MRLMYRNEDVGMSVFLLTYIMRKTELDQTIHSMSFSLELCLCIYPDLNSSLETQYIIITSLIPLLNSFNMTVRVDLVTLKVEFCCG